MLNEPCLLVVLGATATGKTNLAIKLAQAFDAPIISADSRQVYRHFDIGTAKPTLDERAGVPHYLLDIAEPTHNFTLAEYQQQAQQLIGEFHGQGLSPVLVGGTGLYIKSVISGLQIPRVAPHPELRKQLAGLGQTHCYQILQAVDAPASAKIHPHDSNRTLRALEVFYVTGAPLTHQQKITVPSYPVLRIGLTSPDRPTYLDTIERRIRQMLKQGWLDEIQFIQTKYDKSLPLLRTIGYAEMTDYLAGKLTLESAIDLATISTYQFAKRQKTWFRSDRHIVWIDPQSAMDNLDRLFDLVHNRENWQIHTYDNSTDHTAQNQNHDWLH